MFKKPVRPQIMHVPEGEIHKWVLRTDTIHAATDWLESLGLSPNPRHFLVLFVMYQDREAIFREDDTDDQTMKCELLRFMDKFDSDQLCAADVERVLCFRRAWSDVDRRRARRELQEALDSQAFSQ